MRLEREREREREKERWKEDQSKRWGGIWTYQDFILCMQVWWLPQHEGIRQISSSSDMQEDKRCRQTNCHYQEAVTLINWSALSEVNLRHHTYTHNKSSDVIIVLSTARKLTATIELCSLLMGCSLLLVQIFKHRREILIASSLGANPVVDLQRQTTWVEKRSSR